MTDIIHDLELSVRATNVLTAYGRVKTLEDFMALDKKTIMAQPNSGARTWKEIQHMQTFLRGTPLPALAPTLARDATLRDAAAMAALQGILANPNDNYGPENMRYAASYAWQAADAFIAAREGKTE
jgi:hypothetical protein